jgi:hypothetical protein
MNLPQNYRLAKALSIWPESSHTLVSLWDMVEFFEGKFKIAWDRLEKERTQAKEFLNEHGEECFASGIHKTDLATSVGLMERCCVQLEMKRSLELIRHFKERTVPLGRLSFRVVEVQILGIQQTVSRELDERKFALILPEKVRYFQQENLFDEAVSKAFPSAVLEIKDAGNCLALELESAAVFHLMITVEYGLRALAKRLRGVKLKRDLRYSDWGTVIMAIKTKLGNTSPRSTKGQARKEFYLKAMDDCDYFKDVWRNNTFHGRKRPDKYDSEKAFEKVRDFMQRLAANGFKEKIKL